MQVILNAGQYGSWTGNMDEQSGAFSPNICLSAIPTTQIIQQLKIRHQIPRHSSHHEVASMSPALESIRLFGTLQRLLLRMLCLRT